MEKLRTIWCRLVGAAEPWVGEWLARQRPRNGFLERTLSYPKLKVWAAEDSYDQRRLAVMMQHPVLMLDSCATREGIHEVEAGRALLELLKVGVADALASGIQEIAFLDSDPVVTKAAEKLGFQQSQYKLYLMRLPLPKELL